jgi:hypothetical protein
MAPARRVMSHEYGSTQFDFKIQMSWFLPGSTSSSRNPILASKFHRHPAFTYMFGFPKFQITTELWCLVVWSAQGLDYHTKFIKNGTKLQEKLGQIVYNKFRTANCSHGYEVPIWIPFHIRSADKFLKK